MRMFGIGALVAGSIAGEPEEDRPEQHRGDEKAGHDRNVLDFGPAIGLPELGFWGIILATLFLGLGWGGKMLITAIVFLADPGWFHRAAEVHWPDTSFKNFVAIALLALIATRPRASRRWDHHHRRRARC